jgi:hypothetical protein
MMSVRQSAKAKNVQEAESSMMQSHYHESQAPLADKAMEDALLIQGMSHLPVKYIPRKMSR